MGLYILRPQCSRIVFLIVFSRGKLWVDLWLKTHSCLCSVTQSCLTLCDPLDCSPPDSSVHGISQARRLEWVAISFLRGSSSLRNLTHVSCIAGRFFTAECPRNTVEKLYTLCPMVIFYKTIISSIALQLKWSWICLQCRRPGFNPWLGKILWRREW